MRTWEKLDITDILKEYHGQLVQASTELADGGDHEGWREYDDKALVIEDYLEETHSVGWDGIKFIKQEKKGN
jgi:hypothetical protein